MAIDAVSLQQLRDRGALIGSANADHWEQLLKKHGMGALCWAIGEARSKLQRQPSVQDVEDKLPGKPKVPAAASAPSPAARARVIAAAGDTVATLDAVVDAMGDDQVDEPEHAPTPAAAAQPATERRPTVDWQELLRQFPGTSATELATRAQRPRTAAFNWLSNHPNLVTYQGESPRRYWLKADPAAPAPAPTTTQPEEQPVPKQIPVSDLRDIAKQLGTFKVADLAKKAKCSPPTARNACELMEADGFIVREEAGNRRSPYVVAGVAAKPGPAPGGGVKAAASRRSPAPRREAVMPNPLPFDLDGHFDELLGRLVDAYAEKHDLGPKPSARRALLEAAAAVFPTEA